MSGSGQFVKLNRVMQGLCPGVTFEGFIGLGIGFSGLWGFG